MPFASPNAWHDPGMTLVQIGYLQLAIIFAVWLVCGAVAWTISPDRPALYFWVTFLILGPLGVAVALVAGSVQKEPEVKRAVAEGRRRFVCPRCGAENDIPEAERSYECWRCSERRTVKAATAKSAPKKG
jgi:DNA-directed RNA polymerase subunit RPC12/RpoP